MAKRPIWQGHLRLSLVTCPVVIYGAIDSDARVRFHMVNPKTMNRINIVAKDPDTGLVDRSSLVKGYETGKGKYVLLTESDFDAIKLESTRIVDIERFVPETDIDRIYWESPRYMLPDGKTGIEAFAVIREAMARQEQVALGRLVINGRERLCAMEPRENCILLTTLRSYREIRKPNVIVRPDLPSAPARDTEAALALIGKLAGKFEPRRFVDRYDQALRSVIKRRQKGHKVEEVAEPEQKSAEVVDLSEALRRSLERAATSPSRAAVRGEKRRRRA